MESVRAVFETVDLSPYDYFVYLNCGMVGPRMPWGEEEESWTERYTSLLSDNTDGVLMSRASIMLFALDRDNSSLIPALSTTARKEIWI
mmetsp:Transcript_32546/g.68768  ORF Transcript_32546/g.68768 Transcript_32546/m.68768 type:complete len:89 (+) Transcript_32546:83-349(+)